MPRKLTNSNNVMNNHIKKLLFRSRYRGIKEMDIILENFAKKHLLLFSKQELQDFEEICQIPDQDLYNYIRGKSEIPSAVKRNNVFIQLKAFTMQGNITDYSTDFTNVP